jgi:ribosomal protein L11
MKRLPMYYMINKKTKCHFTCRVKKLRVVRLFLPVGIAEKEPAMATTLGLYGLKAEDICTTFNEQSLPFYRPGVIVSAIIFVTAAKTFFIELADPTIFAASSRIMKYDFRAFYHDRKKIMKDKFFRKILYNLALYQNEFEYDEEEKLELYYKYFSLYSTFYTYNLDNLLRLLKIPFNWRTHGGSRNRKKTRGKIKR